MIKTIICLLALWSMPVFSNNQNIGSPSVIGLNLGDSQSQLLSILGPGEPMALEPGVFSVFYERVGLTFTLSEQAGANRIEQIELSRFIPGGLLGVQVGQSRSVIERNVGELNFVDTDDSNDGLLRGQGWLVHFIFNRKGILERIALATIIQPEESDPQ